MENESVRQEAVEATLERNPNAFRPKIFSSPSIRDLRVCQLKFRGCLVLPHNNLVMSVDSFSCLQGSYEDLYLC